MVDELFRLNVRVEIAEAALLRMRKKLCEALADQPTKLDAARKECGICAGIGPCII